MEQLEPEMPEPRQKKAKADISSGMPSVKHEEAEEVPVARYPSRHAARVRLKIENSAEGLIKCPKCSSGVAVSERGCNLVTCRFTR